MTTTESLGGSEQVDLKRDLHRFVEAINGMGREFGLNPHIEQVRLEDPQALWRPTIAVVSELSFAARLKKLLGMGNIIEIKDAPPVNGNRFVDYLFVYKRPLKTEVFSKVLRFVQKVERKTGVRIYLTPKDNLTQWENEQ